MLKPASTSLVIVVVVVRNEEGRFRGPLKVCFLSNGRVTRSTWLPSVALQIVREPAATTFPPLTTRQTKPSKVATLKELLRTIRADDMMVWNLLVAVGLVCAFRGALTWSLRWLKMQTRAKPVRNSHKISLFPFFFFRGLLRLNLRSLAAQTVLASHLTMRGRAPSLIPTGPGD